MTFCKVSNQLNQPFVLPDLPYSKDAFSPHFTPETFDYHHGKHHQVYVTNLNNLLPNLPEYNGKDLETIILESHNKNPAVFNNSAQIWNHSFFWHCFKVGGGGKPSGEVLKRIEKSFGTYENFATEFKQAAITQFGSGWAWLVKDGDGFKIVKTSNAETPITSGLHPVLTIDVWEHAYYIDYRNRRPDFASTFIEHCINWDFVGAHL